MVVFSKVTASKSVPRQLRAVLGEATILKPKICEGGYFFMWFSCYCYCYFCHWPSFTWFSSSPRQPVDFGLSLELSFRDIFPPPTTFSTFSICKWECEHGVPLNNDYFNLLVGNLFINKMGFCKPGWIFFQNNVCLFISFFIWHYHLTWFYATWYSFFVWYQLLWARLWRM